jgi:hypothetical protein
MYLKLNALKYAISAAIITALFLFLLPVSAIYLGKGIRTLEVIGKYLPGYDKSWLGAVIGAAYGFVISFVLLGADALLYNCLIDYKGLKKKAKKAAKKKKK